MRGEKSLQEWIEIVLRDGQEKRSVLQNVQIRDRSLEDSRVKKLRTPVASLYDLIRDEPYEPHPHRPIKTKGTPISVMFNALHPDVAVDSKNGGGHLRIYIEVKPEGRHSTQGFFDSQLVLYFLHLLVTTNRDESKIRRAMLLAAPSGWFEREQKKENSSEWEHLVQTYAGLAAEFDITLGEIRLD